MALFDSPPHRCTIHGPQTSTRDSAGGTVITWPTVRQADVPCSINTGAGSQVLVFAQLGLTITHTVAFLASVLTDGVHRGDKITKDSTGDTYFVEGIANGDEYNGVPAFVYIAARQIVD